ncbi:MAG: HEAT repeat domain-containing protein [Planctomycetaceae bacterium]
MTACYAKDRYRAIHKLGDRYDCCCHPEVMNALVYGLNDSDERVRRKAADEIGDQVRRNRCCCGPCVISALTCALGDCDRRVRRQAEEALERCGYEIVDGCCGCGDGCGNGCCQTACDPACSAPCNSCAPAAPAMAAPVQHAAPAQPTPAGEAVPAPAPPEEPQAYFPSRLHKTNASKGRVRSTLAGLFGLAR